MELNIDDKDKSLNIKDDLYELHKELMNIFYGSENNVNS